MAAPVGDLAAGLGVGFEDGAVEGCAQLGGGEVGLGVAEGEAFLVEVGLGGGEGAGIGAGGELGAGVLGGEQGDLGFLDGDLGLGQRQLVAAGLRLRQRRLRIRQCHFALCDLSRRGLAGELPLCADTRQVGFQPGQQSLPLLPFQHLFQIGLVLPFELQQLFYTALPPLHVVVQIALRLCDGGVFRQGRLELDQVQIVLRILDGIAEADEVRRVRVRQIGFRLL